MTAPRTHIALLGHGSWGRRILDDLRVLGCRVTVIDPDPAARELVPRDAQVSVAAAVDDALCPDGVVVATPASLHAASLSESLHWGVPIFCEKPLAVSSAEAEAMVRAAGERLFVMHIWRYHPGIEALAAIAASAELGPVTALFTSRTNWVSSRTDVDPVWTLVPHDLTIALAILGAIPEPRHARVERLEGRPVGMLAMLGEDPWFAFEVSTRHREKRREVRLHCRDGVAVLPHGESAALEILTGRSVSGPRIEHRAVDLERPLLRELRCFVAHLRGGPPPPTTAAEGLEVVRAVEALRRLAGVP